MRVEVAEVVNEFVASSGAMTRDESGCCGARERTRAQLEALTGRPGVRTLMIAAIQVSYDNPELSRHLLIPVQPPTSLSNILISTSDFRTTSKPFSKDKDFVAYFTELMPVILSR